MMEPAAESDERVVGLDHLGMRVTERGLKYTKCSLTSVYQTM